MIRHLAVVTFALALLAGCSAFDHDNTPYEGFSPDQISADLNIAAGAYEGDYTGTMKLDSKSDACAGITEEVGAETPIKLNIVQAGVLVSVGFEDGSEESGKLIDTKVTVVKRGDSDVRMFFLSFLDAGIEGTADVYPASKEAGIESCGSYSFTLSRIE